MTTHFVEKSSGSVLVRFRDRNDQPITPTSAKYTITDDAGNVINNKEDIAISSLATQVELLLSGDDLAISSGFAGVSEERILTIEATYDSDLGNDLPLNEQAIFYVDQLIAIT